MRPQLPERTSPSSTPTISRLPSPARSSTPISRGSDVIRKPSFRPRPLASASTRRCIRTSEDTASRFRVLFGCNREGTRRSRTWCSGSIYRCSAAKSESVIPRSALAEQFPQDKNPRCARQHAREAITQLRLLWPGIRVEATETGIWVDRAVHTLLLDDPSKGRVRRLS